MINNPLIYQRGMTMVEMMVTITILSILSVLVVSAFPNQRDHQQLVSAEQEVQAVIRQAQQMSLDQKREDDCIATEEDESLCSKIGVAFRGNEIIFFADTAGTNYRYNPGDDNEISGMRTNLPETVSVVSDTTIIFEAEPPTVVMFFNGINAFRDVTPEQIVLRTTGDLERILEVHPYAQVELVN